MVINDFLRGKIPWYIPDPNWPERKGKEPNEEFEGRRGKLGEMPDKTGDSAANEDEVNDGDSDDQEDDDDSEDDSEGDSWDGSDVETDSDANEGSDDEISEDDEGDEGEEERLEDPRPVKRVRV